MAKPARYTLRWSPTRQRYELFEGENITALDLPTRSLAWLQEVSSFAFDGRQGAYTARKETKQRGESYWYAYRKRAGKLKKTYLGKSTDLTLARLEEVADLLSHDAAAQSIMLPAPFPPSSSRTSAALGAVEGKTAGDTEPGARASAQPDRAHDPLLATRI